MSGYSGGNVLAQSFASVRISPCERLLVGRRSDRIGVESRHHRDSTSALSVSLTNFSLITPLAGSPLLRRHLVHVTTPLVLAVLLPKA